ncbi:MAG: endo-1,3-alpha-glucanase family glycosylhydrolase [Ilumatobacteraceae bacterium]
MSAGLDGFVFNILGIDDSFWNRLLRLLDAAAEVDPEFDIVLMPDVQVDPQALADAIASVADHPSVGRNRDGRLIISPFAAERQGVEWWSGWLDLMNSTYGVQVSFVPLLLDYYGNVEAFAPISAGLSHWGAAAPPPTPTCWPTATTPTRAASSGCSRVRAGHAPRAGLFYEAANTENLRLTWQAAIDGGAEWVQLVTWNDYSEHSAFAPSTGTGWVPLDLSSYYLTWFKTGVAPPIVRDAAYVSHRTQPVGAVPTGGQTQLMTVRPEGSEVRDTVEVVLMLASPVDVVVDIGAERHEFRAEAGVTTHVFPLSLGTVSVRLVYSPDLEIVVTSPEPVTDQPVVQDLLYHMVGSARDGQFVGFTPPTTTAPPTTVPETAAPTATGDEAPADTATATASPATDGATGETPATTAAGGDDADDGDDGDDGDGGVSTPLAVGLGVGIGALGGAGALALVRRRRARR